MTVTKTTLYPVDAETGQLVQDIKWGVKPSDPFTYWGIVIGGPTNWGQREGAWKDNAPFKATMTYESMAGGMSIWRDEATGVTWPMFPTELGLALEHGGLDVATGSPTKITGTFDVVKRSTRYALRWRGI